MYFNLKYKHTGNVFQDAYKATLVVTEPQFVYLSKYIHRQALASKGESFRAYRNDEAQPSSYEDYLGLRKTEWVHPEEVLAYFRKSNPQEDYASFVRDSELGPIENIVLEE